MYSGDEIGTLNDYTYRDDSVHERDSRWVHCPRAHWEKYKKRDDLNTVEGQVYQGLKKLIELRKQLEAFAGSELEIIQTENEQVLGFMRTYGGKRAVIFANFSENLQNVCSLIVEQYSVFLKKHLHGLGSLHPKAT